MSNTDNATIAHASKNKNLDIALRALNSDNHLVIDNKVAITEIAKISITININAYTGLSNLNIASMASIIMIKLYHNRFFL